MGFKFYSIDEEYAKFLRDNYDNHVAYIRREGYKHDKFFIGTIFEVNSIKYFAPVSSFKNKNGTTFNIKDGEKVIASVRLGYMFPVVDDVYHLLPVDSFEGKYKIFIFKELRYCNNHDKEIIALAEELYRKRTTNKYDSPKEQSIFEMYTCNYKALEIGVTKYKPKK